MTDTNHPITPPLELLRKWAAEYWVYPSESIGEGEHYIATQAARWGSDQELEACCEHLKRSMSPRATIDYLRAARRPKPPSLKEQALDLLDRAEWNTMTENLGNEKRFGLDEIEIIRRALEALDD